MKKSLFTTLIFIFSTTLQLFSQTCSFNVVGTTSVSTTSALSDMAVGPNNKAYTIAYNSTTGKIELQSAFTASSSWTLNAVLTTTTNIKPVINIRGDGKIYVFIRDGLAGNVGKVYFSTGGAFTQLGSAVSAGAVSDLSIAFNSFGAEYIAYTDGANSNYSTVKKWDGSSWVNVGTTGIASTNSGFFNSLVIDNTNTPVLAFRDFANGYKISVMKLSGSNWVPVTGTGTVSANAATNSVLKVASNGYYYLGYTETSDQAIVQTFNGTTWAALGSPVSGLLSTANSFDFDLDPTDVPYYMAILNTAYYPTSYKYAAGTWTTLTSGYINSANSTNATMDIDNTGSPYFSYADVGANNSLNVKTLVSPLSISTQPLSTQTICNNAPGSFSVAVSGGTATYQWQSATTGAFANAGAPYVNASTNVVSFTATSGINQNKLRCVINVGCKNIISNTSTLTVSSPMVSLITTNPNCFGMCNGMINSSISGGISPYTYTWSTGSNASGISSLCAGTYSLSITDNNGCSASNSANVVSPPDISSSISGTTTICNGSSTTLTLTATGGTGAYTYSWSPGASLNTTTSAIVVATPSANQTYTATITDANGCIKSSTVTITVNALPSVSAGPDITICFGSSATLMASGTANTYTWNPGNLVGSVQNVMPLSMTNYSVVGTNTLTGCTNSDIMTVFVNPNPTVTASSSPTSICVGSSATLTASGAVSYTWNTGQTINTISVSPSSTTVYTVTGMTNGCSNTITVSLNVNTNPTLVITGNTNICKGSTTSLTASGAITYLWNTGAITTSISETPTVTTTYTVIGTDAAGCTSTLTSIVSIISSKTISGIISNTSGTTGGDVTLYKYESVLSQWDSISTVPFINAYSFGDIDSALYVVRAFPAATNIQVTYGDSAISWQNATIINHGCTNNSSQNIKLVALENFVVGPGVLTGVITEGNGFGQRMSNSFKPMAPGNPIGGIIVKGGKNPGGQMLVQTLTDETTGTYTLSGLPLNTGSESYFIQVDIPGLDTNGTYHVVVSSGNTEFNNLNFYVDSMYIHPNTINFIQTENLLLENKIIVYPNPSQQFTYIQYELLQSTEVSVDLYNVVGNKIESILPNTKLEKNKYTHRINTSSLSSGIYFINLKINNSQKVIKLIVNE